MIPKILHFAGFGSDELANSHQSVIQAWQELNNDFEIHFWDHHSLPDSSLFLNEAIKANNHKNALLNTQLYILLRYGGFFLNPSTTLPVKLSDLTVYECLVDVGKNDSDNYTEAGSHILASSPNHPFIKECLHFLINNFTGNQSIDGNLIQARLQFCALNKKFLPEKMNTPLNSGGLLLKSIVPVFKPVREKTGIPGKPENEFYLDNIKNELQRWTYDLPENLEQIRKLRAASHQLVIDELEKRKLKKGNVPNLGNLEADISRLQQSILDYTAKLDSAISNLESYLELNESRVTVLTFNESSLRKKTEEFYQLILLGKSELTTVQDSVNDLQIINKNLALDALYKDLQIHSSLSLSTSLQEKLALQDAVYQKKEMELCKQLTEKENRLKETQQVADQLRTDISSHYNERLYIQNLLQDELALLRSEHANVVDSLKAEISSLTVEKAELKLSSQKESENLRSESAATKSAFEKEIGKLINEKNLQKLIYEAEIVKINAEKDEAEKNAEKELKNQIVEGKSMAESLLVQNKRNELLKEQKEKLAEQIQEQKQLINSLERKIKEERTSAERMAIEITANTKRISHLNLQNQSLEKMISGKDAVLSHLMEDMSKLQSTNDQSYLEIIGLKAENKELQKQIDWYFSTYEKRRLIGIIKDRMMRGLQKPDK